MPRIWLLGFQGATRAGYRRFRDTEPLLLAGHVGVSLDEGRTIYGFSPYAPGLSPAATLEALAAGQCFPGIIRDDRTIFGRAAAAAAEGDTRTPVYLWVQEVPQGTWAAAAEKLAAARDNDPPANPRYCWPAIPANSYNCATWPLTLGVAIPEPSGRLARYIPALCQAAGGRVYAG